MAKFINGNMRFSPSIMVINHPRGKVEEGGVAEAVDDCWTMTRGGGRCRNRMAVAVRSRVNRGVRTKHRRQQKGSLAAAWSVIGGGATTATGRRA